MTIDPKQHPNPYTHTPFNWETFPELCLIARGYKPGQINHIAYRREQLRMEQLAKRSKTTPHKKLVKACVKALREAYPDASISIRNVGIMSYKDKRTGRQIQYRYGTLGESDIDMTEQGMRICLECKVGRDEQRESQARFQERIERAGALYRIVRTVEDALAGVRAALAR